MLGNPGHEYDIQHENSSQVENIRQWTEQLKQIYR